MEKVWYYMRRSDRQKLGPYTDIELVKLINQEIILPLDYIWMPDLENWIRVDQSIYSIYIPVANQ